MLVADHRLVGLAVAFQEVDQVVDDAVLQAHDDVQVAETDVGIYDHDLVTAHGQAGAYVGGGGGLTDPALAGGYNYGLTLHKVSLYCILRTAP